MSSSYISFSTPAIRKMSHSDVTVNTTSSVILNPPLQPERRVVVIIQNKSSTAKIQVILNTSGDVGLLLSPLTSITLDNYNGTVRCISDTSSTLVHIAYGSV